ncbi:hypothetical protein HJFPF1_10313 [Paramyrothecium foliicola]|nr:hypothetical protein HJFPF1_10313 [Paramyrothecium foliicola]
MMSAAYGDSVPSDCINVDSSIVTYQSAQFVGDGPVFGPGRGTGWSAAVYSDENCSGDSTFVEILGYLNDHCKGTPPDFTNQQYWKSFRASWNEI